MLSEPLFTRASTEHLATPFLPALSKCKPGNSLPLSWEAFSPVKTQKVKPEHRKREETQETAPEQVTHILDAVAIAHTPAMSKRPCFSPCSCRVGLKSAPCFQQLRPRVHIRRQRACSRHSPTPQPARICTDTVGPWKTPARPAWLAEPPAPKYPLATALDISAPEETD